MKKIILVITVAAAISCSSRKEVVMPYVNLSNATDRLFPIQEAEAETVLRIWFNNGTSIDRVITVSKDSVNEISTISEIRNVTNGKGKTKIINEVTTLPKSGITNFLSKLDSLNLFSYKTQKSFPFVLDEPFSFYIVEYKTKAKYHQFNFRTSFPNNNDEVNKYTELEKLVMQEFQWQLYLD